MPSFHMNPIKYIPRTKKFLELSFINIERIRKLNGNMEDCSTLFLIVLFKRKLMMMSDYSKENFKIPQLVFSIIYTVLKINWILNFFLRDLDICFTQQMYFRI